LRIEAGRRFGPYFLEEELSGEGGMGRVFQARHEPSGRVSALKVIHSHLADLPQYRARFAREGEILRSLHHPNIVPIVDRGEIDGIPFIETELAEDRDLRFLLGSDLTSSQILTIFRQAAEGLETAHEAGIVHRDIKPGNLLVGREGGELKIMVGDFGVAWGTEFATTHTPHGKAVGTPGFMAPECLKGMPADRRADIYSLGCCLDLMVGPRKRYSPIAQVIVKACAYDPEDRYAKAMALYEAAARALEEGLQPLEEAPTAGLEETAMDTPVRGTTTRPERRAQIVDAALQELGLEGGVLTSRLARGRSDPGLVTAILTVESVRGLLSHANPLAAELADRLGCDRIRLVLLPSGQTLAETVREYFSLILGDRVPSGDLDSLDARRNGEMLEIDLSARPYRLCDEDFLVPLVAQLEVKRVSLNPVNADPLKAR
jgi:hypothetical protein